MDLIPIEGSNAPLYKVIFTLSCISNNLSENTIRLFEFKLKSLLKSEVHFYELTRRGNVVFLMEKASAEKVSALYSKGKIVKFIDCYIQSISLKKAKNTDIHSENSDEKYKAELGKVRKRKRISIDNLKTISEIGTRPPEEFEKIISKEWNRKYKDVSGLVMKIWLSEGRIKNSLIHTKISQPIVNNQNPKVLMVDEEPEFCKDVRLLLEDSKIDVTFSETFPEWSAVHEGGGFDCVIVSLNALSCPITEFIEGKLKNCKSVPFIFMTPYSSLANSLLQSFDSSAIKSIYVKPILIEDFIRKIYDVIFEARKNNTSPVSRPTVQRRPDQTLTAHITDAKLKTHQSPDQLKVAAPAKNYSTCVVVAESKIDWDSSRILDQFLSKIISENMVKIAIDLTNVEYLCSGGIGAIIYNMKAYEEMGGGLYIISNNDYIKFLFAVIGFDKIFKGKTFGSIFLFSEATSTPIEQIQIINNYKGYRK